MSLQSFNSASYLNNSKCIKEESIDYDFYDSCYNEENDSSSNDEFVNNVGVKNVQIKPLKRYSSLDDENNINIENDSENNSFENKNLATKNNVDITKCIAFENSESCSSPDIECTVSKSSGHDEECEQEEDSTVETVSPILDSFSSLSASTPSSELTNITPFSSSRSSSSMKGNTDVDNYSTNFEEEDEEDSSRLDMKLLSDVVDSLRQKPIPLRSLIHSSSRTPLPCRPRRKNMTFTNEQMRKIERENEILLKKIMSYTKPKSKQPALISTHALPPRIKASAAVNRFRKQQQINHDNFLLLKKIHNVKPTQSLINKNKIPK